MTQKIEFFLLICIKKKKKNSKLMILRRILLSSLLLPLWRETRLNEVKRETVSTTQRTQPKCRAGEFIGRM